MKAPFYRTFVKKFSDYPMHYLEVPKREIKRLGGKFRARLVCKLNGKLSFQCGLMALGDGQGFITLSKQRLQELDLAAGDQVRVELKPDTSKYGLKMPAEFREVLKQDPEGRARFAALKPGKQRTLLFHVGSAKSVDKRIERALFFLENLKRLPHGQETIPAIFGKRSQPGSGRW
jgi:hypothetical protein